MSIRVNVTKHYKHVLPKVKGHRWAVDYMPGETFIGNVGVYLWRGGSFLGVGEIVADTRG